MSDTQSLPVILLAFANDRSNHLRYLPDEHRRLTDVLRSAVDAKLCELVELANATAGDIRRTFQDRRYRNRIAVFHYGGHAGDYELLLESGGGRAASTSAASLAEFLGSQDSLRLVFLNGCSTRKQTQGLLDAGVDSVITTATAINDFVAKELSASFYGAIAEGIGLQAAFSQATFGIEEHTSSSTRALSAVGKGTETVGADSLPWDLYFREGAESTADWNLPDVANNPLFGLPELPEHDLPASPYRNLHWFRKEHAEVFFGRGREIRDLYQKVINPDTAPIILFYGQSGVGKSSMLDAGLIPRLETAQSVIYLRRDSMQGLCGTLDLAFLPEGAELPPADAWRVREEALQRPLTVILDQLEEVYTRPYKGDKDEVESFLKTITHIFHDRATRPQGRLILGFRKEWLAEVKRKLTDVRLPYTEVFLERLDRNSLQQVIEGPVRSKRLTNNYHLSIEPGLADQITDDMTGDAEGAIAPTLQILLSRMWKAAVLESSSHPRFSRELYTSMRRQGLLLRDFLNRQLELLEKQWGHILSPDLLLDILSMHTTTRGTAEAQILKRLRETYAHHDEQLPQILEGCMNAYLLTVPDVTAVTDNDEAMTRLAHDTLAPLVRERYEKSDHPGQRARRILENRVVEWENGAEGAPLDEQDLSIVEAGHKGMRAWTQDEQRLVTASRVAQSKRMRWRLAQKIFGVTAVTAVLLFGIYAQKQKRQAITQKHAAEMSEKEANKSRKRALDQTLIAEAKAAESFLLPLNVNADEEVSDFELAALLGLASISQEDEALRLKVFEIGLADPQLCLRISSRTQVLLHSAVGLVEQRKNDIREIAKNSLLRHLAEPSGRQCGVLHAHAALIRELGNVDPDLEAKFVDHLQRQMAESKLKVRTDKLVAIKELLATGVSHTTAKPEFSDTENPFAGLSGSDVVAQIKPQGYTAGKDMPSRTKIAIALEEPGLQCMESADCRSVSAAYKTQVFQEIHAVLVGKTKLPLLQMEATLTELTELSAGEVRSLAANIATFHDLPENEPRTWTTQLEICEKLYAALWRAKEPWEVATLGAACAKYLPVGDESNRVRILDKLSLWLYQLPSDSAPQLNRWLEEAMAQTLHGAADASGVDPRKIHKRRMRCAQAMLHAGFCASQCDGNITANESDEFLREIIRGVDPAELLSLLKTPYCGRSSQEVILSELGLHFDDEDQTLAGLDESLRKKAFGNDMLSSGVQFDGAAFFDMDQGDLIRFDHPFVRPTTNQSESAVASSPATPSSR